MDLDQTLLWIVGASSGVGLISTLLRFRLKYPGWIVIHAFNLVALFILTRVMPEGAGIAALLLWTPTVLAPMLGARYAGRLLGMQRYDEATRILRVLAVLHPFDGWREQPTLVVGLSLLQKGDGSAARALFEKARHLDTPLGRMALLHLFRMDMRWEDLRRWFEDHPKREELDRDIGVLSYYLRALGELEDVRTLCRAYARAAERAEMLGALPMLQLFVAAFTGRVDLCRELFRGPLAHYPEELRAFWTATAHQTAGEEDKAREILDPLAEGGGPLVIASAVRRIEAPLRAVAPAGLDEETRSIIEAMAREATAARLATAPASRPFATLTFFILNGIVFLGEIPGGSTNTENLENLGALLVGGGASAWDEPWRLVTACFLHYGPVHLVMNLIGLLVLGRQLERIAGTARLAAVYLAAGVGSSLAYALWAAQMVEEPTVLVGASGSVMGVVGALTAVVLQRYRRDRTRVSKAQLLPLVMMLAVQSVFDIMTPRIAMPVHLAGAVIGFCIGLLLRERTKAAKATAPTESPRRA
jgi:rhomboid protease GluP